ncbi:MAG: DUF2791 family P-loop domain-containing protein [Chloroflexi bacterium]|nr:DUF2791 family P-loop domain-containing protein [Chloroflexota bacterium]
MNSKLRLGRRYQLLERIGSGGMGIVYRAIDRLTGEEVALKSLRFDRSNSSTLSDSPRQRVLLANEFKWLASLRHPNIVSVIDYGFDLIAQPFFTMELLVGYENIVDACQNMPLYSQLAILGQVLHALAYLHRRNVIHRDIKSSNVLVRQQQVKLLDFGLVAPRGQEAGDRLVAGTLAYMPPEAILGDAPSISSDLYSFGVLAFYVLTGRLPFPNQDSPTLINDILSTQVNMSDCVLPDDLRSILARLLLKEPEYRYLSAHDVVIALNQVGANIPVETAHIRESYLKAADFIGRRAEMNQLKLALTTIENRKGAAWLIAGESGIGKSRLIQELRTYALTRGFMILEAGASIHQREPYYIWHNVLRRLRLEVTMEQREQVLVDSILGGATNPLENILARLTNLLVKHLLSQDVVLLILEDIHWADEAGLELLRQLIARVEHLSLMIVASYSTDEAPQLGKQLGLTHQLQLGRFGAGDVQELTESIVGYSDKRLVDLLMQETEGNLYFLVEVLRTLAEKAGTLAQIAQSEWQSRIITGGIRGIIESRLKRISPKHMEILQVAALTGRTVDTRLLSRMTADSEAFLLACESTAIMQVTHNEWNFSHNKLREILEDSILPRHKRELHRRILLELESLYGDEAAARLVYHSYEAQDTERELRYTILVADAALKVFSLNDAIGYYQRAIVLGLKQNLVASTLAQLYQQLGRAFELATQVELAEKSYEEELEVGEERQFSELRLNAQVNFACLYSTPNRLFNNQKARQYINEGLNLAAKLGNRSEQARLYWASMLSNIYTDANTLRAVEDGLRSLSLAQELGDKRLIAFTLHDLSRAYLFEANFERGRTLMEKACELWQAFDHLPMLSDGYGILSILHTFLGNYEKALSLSKKSYDLANEVNSIWGRSVALSFVGTIYMEQGNFLAAAEVMQQCLNYSKAVGNHLPLVLTRSELALAYLQQSDTSLALDTARLALQIANNHQHYHMLELSPKAVLAYCYLMMGNSAQARLIVDSINPPEFSFMMSPNALRLIAETRILLALKEQKYEQALDIAN